MEMVLSVSRVFHLLISCKQELVKHVDIDGDGVVSFEEFCLLLVKRMAVDEEDLAKELARKVRFIFTTGFTC